MPPDSTYTDDTGPITAGAVLRTAGNQTITVTDTAVPGLTGTSNIIAVTATPTPSPTPIPNETPTPSATPTPNETATPTPTASPSATASPAAPSLLNISTRMEVLTGENVLIAGFIVTGTDAKQVLLRGLGPSLPVSNPLPDPLLDLHDSSSSIFLNDNWQDSQPDQVTATGIPPTNPLESAIIASLPASNSGYTAILSGQENGTGIGLVEVYDLAAGANSKLANISTRGFVDTGDNVMIGGFIVGNGQVRVIVRALGPSLPVSNALADPYLDLHDANGTVATNDNWRTGGQEAEIMATTIPPSNDLESAIVRTLPPGNYTAIVSSVNGGTGVALVEVYDLQ